MMTKKKVRKALKNRKLPKPLKQNSVHSFTRKVLPIRFYHPAGTAGATWTIEDNGNYTTGNGMWATDVPVTNVSSTLNNLALNAEIIPNTYQCAIAFKHRFADVVQFGEIQQLFESYKITGVKATITYRANYSQVGGPSVLPKLTYTFDDDDNTPQPYANMYARQDLKTRVLNANYPVSIFYRPKGQKVMASLNNAGVITNTMGPTKTEWLDGAEPFIDHYGLKLYFNHLYQNTADSALIEIEFKYYIKTKGVF